MAIEFAGLDLANILITAGFVTFFGVLAIGFVVFYDKNPYVPRKTYTTIIRDKEGHLRHRCKSWIVTNKKVRYLRIGIKNFPQFKGVEKDISILETLNRDEELGFIESVPDKYEPENYTPITIPITQKDAFIIAEQKNKEELATAILKGTDWMVPAKDEAGNDIKVFNKDKLDELLGQSKLKTTENMVNNSRIVDLNTSKATKEYIAQARREAERVKSDDFIYKYGPIIALLVACVFSYLIIDGSVKAYQSTMGQQNSVMQYGYSQVIQQCGGVYHPIEVTANTTAKPAASTPQIPFINAGG